MSYMSGFRMSRLKHILPIALAIFAFIGIVTSSTEGPSFRDFSRFQRIQPRILEERPSGPRGRFKRDVSVDSTKDTGGHLQRITLDLPIDSNRYLVDLHLNRELLSDAYSERFQKNAEKIVRKPNYVETDLCHYVGTIRNKSQSWAAVSTCDGLSGVVFDGQELHYLEPALQENKWETLHFKDADRIRNLRCDHKSHSSIPELIGNTMKAADDSIPHSRVKRDAKSNSVRIPFNSNEKSRYIEMVLVVDNKKFKELKEDLAQTLRRTKDIANIVNALYSQLNMFIALVGVVVWTEVDDIVLSTKGDDTLSNFLHYRRERLMKDHPNDNAQLLTAWEFDDGVVGKAMQGPICSYKYSGGVNSDHNSLVGIVATTVAHELGHNFGLSHDTESCKCEGPNGKCIMSASSGSNRTAHWSSCSVEQLAFSIEHGMDYCLRNKPKSLFRGPTCGNGFTEPGEECDCGLPEHCNNPCCDAETCRLHSNATCGAGMCCDIKTCHVKAGGTVCRDSKSTCDLPEYCSGDSEFCPDDVFKLSGSQCESDSGSAFCYNGECRTHTDQCKLLWGSTGKNSVEMCYQKNVNGSRYGHCGYNLATQKYAKCARADIKCGALQCEHQNEKLNFGYESVAMLSSFFGNVGGKIYPCRSVTTDFGTQDVDPGLVPSGAPCGDGKMCMDQKCVAVESVIGSLACPDDCNEKGVCNSLGHCHCDEGYGGESCDSGGYGGSVDSGPIINPYGGSSVFAKTLYVTFLGFIPLIAIISFYLYYANDNLKKLCKRGQAVTRAQTRGKPYQNGNAGGRGAKESRDASQATAVPSSGTSADDFFGQYKGFTLTPMRNPSAPNSPNVNGNNNSIQNGTVHGAATAANDYVAGPVQPKIETATLVRNEKPTFPAKQSFLQKGMARVSWAQPIASSTLILPDASDDSLNAQTTSPIYENTNGIARSLALEAEKPQASKARPLSSPDMDTKVFDPVHTTVEKKESLGGSTSALSRLAAAFPFVRNSIRNSTSVDDTTGGNKTKLVTRQKSFSRDVEISRPILQNTAESQKILSLKTVPIGTNTTPDIDTVDSAPNETEKPAAHRYHSAGDKHRYTNVPLEDSHKATEQKSSPKPSPKLGLTNSVKPASKTVERIKGQAPLSPPPTTSEKPHQQKVTRAHSMTQPNRHSVDSSAMNYNSLRRTRPSAPPPKPPPEVTVPPNSVPPPVPAPNKPKTYSPTSILKFKNNNKPSVPASIAPIAKIEAIDIGISPVATPTRTENIYDVIEEDESGLVGMNGNLEEKVETLSNGSAENGGGLLSEIILEIESRNKESIYNSVDRRKKKRLEKEKAEVAARASPTPVQNGSPKLSEKSRPGKGSPRITVNPGFDKMTSDTKPQGKPKSPSLTKKAQVEESNPVVPTSSAAKPTCAVNGIPKVSPSYVAKINYFSNLGSGKNGLNATPMKPINSLSQALITPPAERELTEKETIYAQAPLSTIRPTWSRPYSSGYSPKVQTSNGEVARPSSPKLSSGGGIYGKPVASPKVPFSTDMSNSTKQASTTPLPEVPKIEESPLPAASTALEAKPQIGGYKSFNPYLNRALTFSTFRPASSSVLGDPISKPTTMSSYSTNPTSLSSSNGLTSPVPVPLHQSPTRLVK